MKDCDAAREFGIVTTCLDGVLPGNPATTPRPMPGTTMRKQQGKFLAAHARPMPDATGINMDEWCRWSWIVANATLFAKQG